MIQTKDNKFLVKVETKETNKYIWTDENGIPKSILPRDEKGRNNISMKDFKKQMASIQTMKH